jgi:hypothetical protein
VPHRDSPSHGHHTIKLYCPGFTTARSLEAFQEYFRYLWRKTNVIEEGSLCLKPGEKVWDVITHCVIHNDDGGLIDVLFAACYISLSGIGFPAFDPTSGALFPPSQRRIHKVAFSARPIAVTIGFLGGKILADPTLVEMQMTDGFAVFIFNEWDQLLYIDAQMPGDIEHAMEGAIEVAKNWRTGIGKSLELMQLGLVSVGDPADFIGYEPSAFKVPKMRKVQEFGEFRVWTGDVRDFFVVDFFRDLDGGIEDASDSASVSASDDWLLSAVSV